MFRSDNRAAAALLDILCGHRNQKNPRNIVRRIDRIEEVRVRLRRSFVVIPKSRHSVDFRLPVQQRGANQLTVLIPIVTLPALIRHLAARSARPLAVASRYFLFLHCI